MIWQKSALKKRRPLVEVEGQLAQDRSVTHSFTHLRFKQNEGQEGGYYMKKIFAVLAVTAFLAGCAADKPKQDWSVFDQLWTHVSCTNNAEIKACASLCGGEDNSYIQAKDERKCKGKTYKKGMTNGCYCSF
jgi:hypothetical protein